MFSSRNRLALAAAAGLMAMAASAVQAESIVVRSMGPSAKLYPPGKSIADTATVTLGASDQVTLLDGRGTRTLKGPGSFSLATAGAASGTTAFAALTNAPAMTHARVGAVRSVGVSAPHSPSIWYVDAARSGPVCVADPTSVTLWRADMNSDATLTIKGAGGQSATVSFARGQTSVNWPASLPVSGGAHYSLSWSGAPSSTISFALLGGNAAGIENTAAALIRNGCSAQLDLLVDVMSLPETNGAPQG